MFNSIEGKITAKTPDHVFIATNGLEWDISVSRNCSLTLPGPGTTARLYLHLHHREDQMRLFGFFSPAERDLFFALLKVESIGPSLALKILSGITCENFIQAVEREDLALLSSVPGVGKKTAQKIVLKLSGKLAMDDGESGTDHDIVLALTGMGFGQKESRDAVKAALREVMKGDLTKEEFEKELLKTAIKLVGK
ncbi:MAG: Holliday junction branch migration protein RuvA [Spirochaetales bacterium]|nr:Holliday junction branch migration protein RuvA [Spirochaetales bacterium]